MYRIYAHNEQSHTHVLILHLDDFLSDRAGREFNREKRLPNLKVFIMIHHVVNIYILYTAFVGKHLDIL